MCLKPPSPIGQQVAALFGSGSADPLAGAGERPTPAPPSLPPAAPMRSRRLWDLEHKHHCPIIGTCLGVDELQRFARRHDFTGDRRDEFGMHVEAASRAGTRNALSEDVHKHLDRKYATALRRFASIDDDAGVCAAWQEHLARGEVAGPLWATLTHRAASAATRQRVYADIHMLSHQVGAGQAADARRLAHLESENAELQATAERERRERTAVESRWREALCGLQADKAKLLGDLAEADVLRRRLTDLESGVAVVELGRKLVSLSTANEQLSTAARRAGELERELGERNDELAAACCERDQARRERDALERILLPSDASDSDACAGRCAACPVAPEAPPTARCVLCVGGRTALVGQYRALAERIGIRLIHHDGGLEEAISRLPDMINGADAVICPTDCVSHSAYYRLKNHCKRTSKPCLLFKGAGISSFAVALANLAGGRVSVAGAATEAWQ